MFITQQRVGFQESISKETSVSLGCFQESVSTETPVYHSAMDCFQESIYTETCSPTRSLAVGLHITICLKC
jgi:hypothetical protein